VAHTENPNSERRQSFRCPASGTVRGELVLADQSRWPVRLLDESAGGFAVLTEGPLPLAQGDVLELSTDSFCSQVRVAHSAEVNPSDGGANGAARQVRLGLVRVADFAAPENMEEGRRRWTSRRTYLPDLNRNQLVTFLAVLAIPAIAIAVIGVLFSNPSSLISSGNSSADESTSQDPIAVPKSVRGVPLRASTLVELPPDDVKRLLGAAPFVTTRVIRELQLTDSQLRKIRRILDDTERAIAQNREFRLLLDTAQQKVLNLLNSRQRQRWEAFRDSTGPRTDESLANGSDE
jgi:hypothetical protein